MHTKRGMSVAHLLLTGTASAARCKLRIAVHMIRFINRCISLTYVPLTKAERVAVGDLYQSMHGMNSVVVVRRALFSAGQLVTESELTELLSRVGYVDGRVLSLPDFERVMELRKKNFEVLKQSSDTEIAFFGLLQPEEHDLSCDLFRDICKQYRLTIDVEKLIREADADGTGRIDLEEFTQLLSQAAGASSAGTSRAETPSDLQHQHESMVELLSMVVPPAGSTTQITSEASQPVISPPPPSSSTTADTRQGKRTLVRGNEMRSERSALLSDGVDGMGGLASGTESQADEGELRPSATQLFGGDDYEEEFEEEDPKQWDESKGGSKNHNSAELCVSKHHKDRSVTSTGSAFCASAPRFAGDEPIHPLPPPTRVLTPRDTVRRPHRKDYPIPATARFPNTSTREATECREDAAEYPKGRYSQPLRTSSRGPRGGLASPTILENQVKTQVEKDVTQERPEWTLVNPFVEGRTDLVALQQVQHKRPGTTSRPGTRDSAVSNRSAMPKNMKAPMPPQGYKERTAGLPLVVKEVAAAHPVGESYLPEIAAHLFGVVAEYKPTKKTRPSSPKKKKKKDLVKKRVAIKKSNGVSETKEEKAKDGNETTTEGQSNTEQPISDSAAEQQQQQQEVSNDESNNNGAATKKQEPSPPADNNPRRSSVHSRRSSRATTTGTGKGSRKHSTASSAATARRRSSALVSEKRSAAGSRRSSGRRSDDVNRQSDDDSDGDSAVHVLSAASLNKTEQPAEDPAASQEPQEMAALPDDDAPVTTTINDPTGSGTGDDPRPPSADGSSGEGTANEGTHEPTTTSHEAPHESPAKSSEWEGSKLNSLSPSEDGEAAGPATPPSGTLAVD